VYEEIQRSNRAAVPAAAAAPVAPAAPATLKSRKQAPKLK
jgi:hypothetical protein